jgi:hypothetical protein
MFCGGSGILEMCNCTNSEVVANCSMRLSIILGVIWLSIVNCNGQDDPLTLAKAIFARQKFENLNKHVTGEYIGRPNGTDLPNNVNILFELLDKNDKAAVVAMTIVDSTGNAFDTYLHFVNDNVWKVTAFRALALTRMYGEILANYDKMTQLQRDSLNLLQGKAIEIPGYSYKPKSMDWTIKNARLVLSSDKDLINYFKTNKEKFEALKDGLLRKGILQSNKRLEELDDSKLFQGQIDILLIENVGRSIFGYSENLEFVIGGMTDNAVGYLFVKDKKNKPSMTPNGFIMIREIGNGWYLFKTT